MQFSWEEIFELGKELGITTSQYQNKADSVYRAFNFLMQCETEPAAANEMKNRNAISVRLQKDPPSLQIIKAAASGGVRAEQRSAHSAPIQILTEANLNREILLLTPSDTTLIQLNFYNMLPKELWEFSQKIKTQHPDIWLVLQRFSFQSPETTNMPFAFHAVKASDENTWDYLKELPLELIG